MRQFLTRFAFFAIIVLALLGPSALAWAQQPDIPPYFGLHMWDGSWEGWFFSLIMIIVFVALAVVVIVLVIGRFGGTVRGGAPQSPPGKSALDVLRERYARGEIDKEEFEEQRRVLSE